MGSIFLRLYLGVLEIIRILSVSFSVEYYNQISTYGINGCRSTFVAASGRD